MSNVTFVIPYANHHQHIVARAITLARGQTVQANVITIHDSEGRGAGWARNQGLAQVETDFTVFLDADDGVSPYFVERTLKAWQAKHYVYTDWLEEKERIDAPHCPFAQGKAHCITALIPTAYLRAVNGFDETLPAGEDSDLFLKLMTMGFCGLHLRDPLFIYERGGLRSKTLVSEVVDGKPVYTDEYHKLVKYFNGKYGRRPMACCGENEVWEHEPAGERQAGDILVEAMWDGNRQVRGMQTGRLYPRNGNRKPMYVAAEDAYAMPEMFRIVPTEPEVVFEAPDAMEVFREAFDVRPPLPQIEAPVEEAPKPDFGRVIGAYKRA